MSWSTSGQRPVHTKTAPEEGRCRSETIFVKKREGTSYEQWYQACFHQRIEEESRQLESGVVLERVRVLDEED